MFALKQPSISPMFTLKQPGISPKFSFKHTQYFARVYLKAHQIFLPSLPQITPSISPTFTLKHTQYFAPVCLQAHPIFRHNFIKYASKNYDHNFIRVYILCSHTVATETRFWRTPNRHFEQFKAFPQKSTRLPAWGNHIFRSHLMKGGHDIYRTFINFRRSAGNITVHVSNVEKSTRQKL